MDALISHLPLENIKMGLQLAVYAVFKSSICRFNFVKDCERSERTKGNTIILRTTLDLVCSPFEEV